MAFLGLLMIILFLTFVGYMNTEVKKTLIAWAEEYNDPKYFQEDPIIFPTGFARLYEAGKASLADVEISALLAAHLAWGRRAMIVRDCGRMFDEMCWKPYDYVMNGEYRDENVSLHRTIKWSEFAAICGRLRTLYSEQASNPSCPASVPLCDCPTARHTGLDAGSPDFRRSPSLEGLTDTEIRVKVFGQKEDRKAPNKKISMMRRWLVRDDGKVDLGVWKKSDKSQLILPLDVHVYDQATALGLTARKPKDIITAREITEAFKEIWPDDPCKGDFALFGYGVTHK